MAALAHGGSRDVASAVRVALEGAQAGTFRAGGEVLDLVVDYADPGGPRSPKMTAAGEWRKAKRSDGYRDCLHFCAPGPLNLVPALLQQVLEECARG